MGSVERFFAVFIQIALSLFVLMGVVKKKISIVIFIHAVIEFPFIFVQTGYIKLWMVEPYLAVVGILCMLYIKKTRKLLPDTSST
ncbi:YhfC family glutamic-type intramembrane protease [Neobacillus mesonae]|uniref:YhfC family glutamic-type intramembrane protease n=1 Tax=Neobacillus mesonae TaxID=1193713 RepID=UPI0008358B8C|nr:YhfC family glutamic-type intramembrane protease [Neobacillus mesonae]